MPPSTTDAARPQGEPEARDGLTVLAYSFMSVDREKVRASLSSLREAHPDWIFIAGGSHPSAQPAGALAMGFDHVFVGEGELTLPWFLHRLETGQPSPRIVKPIGPVELDRFLSFAPGENLLAPIELSRGCPFACRFCHVPFIQGRRMRHRSVESVLEHVRIARTRGRRRTWFVTSDAFAYGSLDGKQGDRHACERLLKGCRDEGMDEVFWGNFPSEVRPDHVRPELLELVVKYCTNRTILLGAQSGSEEALRRMARGHTAAVVMEAVRLIRSFGLTPHVDFMLGLPGETPEERRLTLEAIEEIGAVHGGKAHLHYFMPHPGTPWARAVPTPLDDATRARLEAFTGREQAYGYWRQQRDVSEK